MAVSVNMDSAIAKAKDFMDSDEGEERSEKIVNRVLMGEITLQSKSNGKVHKPEEAAEKFIEVLKNSINESILSGTAKESILGIGISHDVPEYVGGNKYIVTVYFSGNTYRPSLQEEKYGGIIDIVDLLNYGAGPMQPVYGTWHGKPTRSRTTIPATNFIEDAVSTFRAQYASKYNVIDIFVNTTY